VEHEPEDIWYSVARTVREAVDRSGRDPKTIAAIGITNQRETVVVWDRASGRPLGRAIVWQDRRTTDFCREKAGDEPWLTSKTGLVLDPYFSGTKIRWLVQNSDGLRRKAAAGELAFGTIDSFLIWRLTGGAVHVTDATNASRTLLFNIHSLGWDDELLKYFDVRRDSLPEVKGSVADFGSSRKLDFLPDGIPIRGVAGDQQAALFGQRCFQPGEAKCTYGTGAFFLVHTGDAAVTSQRRLLTTVAAMTDAKPKYALEGAVFIAGAAVQWLRDGLHLVRASSEIERLAREQSPADPVVFVPAFVGLGSPHWVPEARGVIFGISRATTAGDLARAALDGVALQVADLVEAAEHDARAPLSVLKVDGGMAANGWFLQAQADILNRPVARAGHNESTALGAAFLAAVGAGLADEERLKTIAGESSRMEPAMRPGDREKKRAAWKKAVNAVISFYRAQH
jgi:glycerol kinase